MKPYRYRQWQRLSLFCVAWGANGNRGEVNLGMKLLLYFNETGGEIGQLRAVVEGLAPAQITEVCPDIISLARRLRKRKGDLTVVVLYTSTRDQLAEIVAIREFLVDLRILLILPDRERETISQGLTLRPRYFSFVDADFSDVSAVLAKMLDVYGREDPGYWQGEALDVLQ